MGDKLIILLTSNILLQNIPLFNVNISQNKDGNQQQKWCLDINRESQKIVIEHCKYMNLCIFIDL